MSYSLKLNQIKSIASNEKEIMKYCNGKKILRIWLGMIQKLSGRLFLTKIKRQRERQRHRERERKVETSKERAHQKEQKIFFSFFCIKLNSVNNENIQQWNTVRKREINTHQKNTTCYIWMMKRKRPNSATATFQLKTHLPFTTMKIQLVRQLRYGRTTSWMSNWL